MTLPHSLFGSQVHKYEERHWWQRYRLPRLWRTRIQQPGTNSPPAAPGGTHPDIFARNPRPVTPPTAPNTATMPFPLRDGDGNEGDVLRHFAEVGYDNALSLLQGANARLVKHVADAACNAEHFDVARALYDLAHARAGARSRLPKHLQHRAQTAAQQRNAAAQRLYLTAWMDTQSETPQALARGCLQACALNPALTRKWYIKACAFAQANHDTIGMETLSRSLLQSLAYAMLMEGAPANGALLATLQTTDPQLLSWVANAARVAGNLPAADELEKRAQNLSAATPNSAEP